MDAIGSSTKLMWFFVFIYSFPILLLILSVAIWSYKKFKRFAFISYIADTTLTVLILLGDISNLVSRFIKGTPMYHLNLWKGGLEQILTIQMKTGGRELERRSDYV